MKVSFRPPWPLGIPWLWRRGMGLGRRPEGVGGNACASRAWKGNGWPDIRLLVSFLGFAESNIIELTGLGKTSWPVVMPILTDKFGRPITDLRISITDRCNYKCVYCRTGNEGALYGDLPFSDYLRMARIFAALGIKKIRITGGEPLLRKGVVDFVAELARLRDSDGE